MSEENTKSRVVAKFNDDGKLRFHVDGANFGSSREALTHQHQNERLARDPTCGGLLSQDEHGEWWA